MQAAKTVATETQTPAAPRAGAVLYDDSDDSLSDADYAMHQGAATWLLRVMQVYGSARS